MFRHQTTGSTRQRCYEKGNKVILQVPKLIANSFPVSVLEGSMKTESTSFAKLRKQSLELESQDSQTLQIRLPERRKVQMIPLMSLAEY